MPYCPYCGTQLTDNMKFCPSCGAQTVTETTQISSYTAYENNRESDYEVVFLSRGTCAKSEAINLVMELMNYSHADAQYIVENAPLAIAENLSLNQAKYLAQAFAEAGTEVTVYGKDGYVDITPLTDSSVYDSNGNLLKGIATVLGVLTVANQVRRFTRWDRGYERHHIFVPSYHRPHPSPRPSLFGSFFTPKPREPRRPDAGMFRHENFGHGNRMGGAPSGGHGPSGRGPRH